MSDLTPASLDTKSLPLTRPTPAQRSIGRGNADPEAVRKAAEDFEAVFISQMLTHMWAGVEVDENFGGGQGEEMFRSVMIEQQGKAIAKAGGLGLAADVQRTMLKMQEVAERGGVQ
jgi:peptidoglycan hydrolase FlgJ